MDKLLNAIRGMNRILNFLLAILFIGILLGSGAIVSHSRIFKTRMGMY